MSAEPRSEEPVQYAAFRLRFRALRIDLSICLGLFFIGGLVTGILLENSVGGRIVVFIVILAAILGYEPLMVARYAGPSVTERATSGSSAHRAMKISQSGERPSDPS
jgi:hypothetical protein